METTAVFLYTVYLSVHAGDQDSPLPPPGRHGQLERLRGGVRQELAEVGLQSNQPAPKGPQHCLPTAKNGTRDTKEKNVEQRVGGGTEGTSSHSRIYSGPVDVRSPINQPSNQTEQTNQFLRPMGKWTGGVILL